MDRNVRPIDDRSRDGYRSPIKPPSTRPPSGRRRLPQPEARMERGSRRRPDAGRAQKSSTQESISPARSSTAHGSQCQAQSMIDRATAIVPQSNRPPHARRRAGGGYLSQELAWSAVAGVGPTPVAPKRVRPSKDIPCAILGRSWIAMSGPIDDRSRDGYRSSIQLPPTRPPSGRRRLPSFPSSPSL